jgi:predicted ArsR family transcriptional regulator
MKKTSPSRPKTGIRQTSPPPERDATAAEMKALAHPLRWRILRVTLDKPMTNKQIAARLGRDPGTVLHHVRTLVREGFLAAIGERSGKRGARELPYVATGKSWRIRMLPSAGNTAAILDAVREEVVERGDDAVVTTLRLGVRLRPDDVAELKARIAQIGDEFEAREAPADDPEAELVGLLALLHRRNP